MTTLVTGATGVVGAPLVRALLERGDELRILVRPDSDVEVLPGVEMDILDGDVTDPGGRDGTGGRGASRTDRHSPWRGAARPLRAMQGR